MEDIELGGEEKVILSLSEGADYNMQDVFLCQMNCIWFKISILSKCPDIAQLVSTKTKKIISCLLCKLKPYHSSLCLLCFVFLFKTMQFKLLDSPPLPNFSN